jgi:sporulation integral membrane protein YtvI
MFNEDFILKLKRFLIFIAIFTVGFIIFLKTISFTIPFIIAFIIALCTKKLMPLFKDKLKLSKAVSAFISTIIVFSIVLIILTIVIYKITSESKQLLNSIPSIGSLQIQASQSVSRIRIYFSHVDPSIVQRAQDLISGLISTMFDFTTQILNALVSFAIGVPMFLLIVVVTLLSTYFFTKDMPDVPNRITSIFAENQKAKVRDILFEATHMLGEYIKAYSFIITISFLEILLGLILLKVKYALILSLVCWVLELVPVLGIFLVFFPLIAIYFLSHNYFIAIALAILWIVVVAVRQVIEPKIVSHSLGLHPLAVLAAIFIGLTVYGFTGMIYILSALVFYKILNNVGVF